MNKAVKFYRDVLGLKFKFESPGWSEFVTGETTLALHPLPTALDENFRAGVQKRDVVRIRNRTSRPPVRFAALDGQSLERRAITEAECTASSCGRICQQA
jgi:catechol 2,3-dioxygenase-like lactoylglutathione lyase family enzyme